LPFEALNPGEARKFEMRFLNPPANTAEVYVHFAPPFMYRSRRDCDFFDPSTFDPEAKLEESAAPSQVRPEKDAPYSAAELNQLTLFYRRESEIAWRCQNFAADCGSDAQRLHWRDMYVMAEAIDEAWVALRAAEESKRRLDSGEGTAAEADAAALAHRQAIDHVTKLGQKALARAGGSAKDVEVSVTSSTYGRDEKGLYVEISGTVHASSDRARKVDALMVAFVDRLELPLSSIAVDVDLLLAPGETREFSHRLEAAAGRGDENFTVGLGRTSPNVAPARVPSRNIPWQVRVGAMTRK
jgi:hypothetical protein